MKSGPKAELRKRIEALIEKKKRRRQAHAVHARAERKTKNPAPDAADESGRERDRGVERRSDAVTDQ